MNKLIIENRTDLSMLDVLSYVANVVERGRISETAGKSQYCFLTVFNRFDDPKSEVLVSAFLNKGSDRLVVYERSLNETSNA